MKFRFIIKDCEELNDLKIIQMLVDERRSELSKYNPLAKRLSEIYNQIDKIINWDNERDKKYNLDELIYYYKFEVEK